MTNQNPPPEPSTTAEELAARHALDVAGRFCTVYEICQFDISETARLGFLAGYAASENDMTPLDERCFRAGVKEGERRRDAEVACIQSALANESAMSKKIDAELTQLRQSLAESERKAAGYKEALEKVVYAPGECICERIGYKCQACYLREIANKALASPSPAEEAGLGEGSGNG